MSRIAPRYKENDLLRVALKQEMELAYTRFGLKYKKISQDITDIYNKAMFSNELNEIQKLHTILFDFIRKFKDE